MWITKRFDEPDVLPPKKPTCRTCVFFDNRRGGKRRRCERVERRVSQNYCCEGWMWDEGGKYKYVSAGTFSDPLD